jgi:hypothetical protein
MRYLLFGSDDCYYAQGGAHDLLGSGDSLDTLLMSDCLKVGGECIAWFHVFDTQSGEIVAGSECQAHGAPDLEGVIECES